MARVIPRQEEFYELVEAKSTIAFVHPFINSQLYECGPIIVGDEVPTAATDGENLYINKEYFKSLNSEQRLAAIAHELFHNMLMHPDRFWHYKSFGMHGVPCDYQALNIAADLIINDMIKRFGIGTLHPDWLWDRDVSYEESLEDVYKRLFKKQPNQPSVNPGLTGVSNPQQGSCQGAGAGSQGNTPQQQGQGVGTAQEGTEEWYYLQPKNGDQPRRMMKQQFDTHIPKESSRSPQEVEAGIQTAMQVAKAIGKLPAEMEKFLKGMFTIKKNWKELLSEYVKVKAGFDQRNVMRPNRRKLYQDRLYIPTRYSWQIEKVALIFDVSGSVSREEEMLFKGTAYDIFSQCKVKELRCLCVNTQVTKDDTFEVLEEFLEWQPSGSGGTDMEAGLLFLEEDGYMPDMCIVLTDGYTNTDVKNKPDFPVIWVTTGSETFAYGEVVKMDVKEALESQEV